MKVILKQDIKGVGKKDQIINANDGYARNYLFPKKLAVLADKENMTNLESKKASQEHKKDIEKQVAQEIAKKIEGILLKLPVKSGENGKVFGSVTSKEISQNLDKQYNIKIDKKKINLEEPIKTLGNFTIEIKLYDNIIAKLKISVISM
ncbi:MAG: 50S ribosomal protein L9 [Clostridia bacterium]|jgi:large subunit ribosomal protein L9|nr:50S ribosomal protein L9 [Clostridia bacterium]